MTGATIDADARTVDIALEETIDIADVSITSVELTNDATADPAITGRHDMREPFDVTLRTYQDYVWTISASQEIERYFTVDGQVGSTEIDAVNRRAIVQVRTTTSLGNIKVRSLKLGPRGLTTYSVNMEDMHDFSDVVIVYVTAHSRTETWRLFVEQTETLVQFTSLSPWTRVAWVSASGLADSRNGFRYRKTGDSEWTETTDVASDGGSFTAMLSGLEPLTEYECMAFSADNETGADLHYRGGDAAA